MHFVLHYTHVVSLITSITATKNINVLANNLQQIRFYLLKHASNFWLYNKHIHQEEKVEVGSNKPDLLYHTLLSQLYGVMYGG